MEERGTSPNNQNLPTSFDVSSLITKLLQIEGGLSNHVVIQRVKIIEVDRYYSSSIEEGDTRLFIAVAYGKQVVLAQLYTLVLRHVVLDDDDEDGDDVDDNGENIEWVEVSDAHELGPDSSSHAAAVIFPPPNADRLPLHLSSLKHDDNDDNTSLSNSSQSIDDANSNNGYGEITSCEIIPAPAITVTDKQKTVHRTVGVTIGTSLGQVYSIPIHISEHICSEPTDDHDDSGKLQFFLEYDSCETITNACENNHHAIVLQILGSNNNNNDFIDKKGKMEQTISVLDGNFVDEDMHVFHPSVPSHELNGQYYEETKTHVIGIQSLAFHRDDATRRNNNGKHKETVVMSQDMIWITYDNGTMVKLPSWKLFSSSLKVTDWSNARNGKSKSDGGKGAGSPFTAVPLNSNRKSPLDAPIDQVKTLQPEINDDEAIMSTEPLGDYWSMLMSAIESTKRTQDKPYQQSESALVLSGQAVSASTMPLQINSSRVHVAPAPTAQNIHDGQNKDFQSPIHEEDEFEDQSASSTADEVMYGPATGAVLGGTTALMKGALGVAVGAMRWGLGKNTGNEDFGEDDSNEEEFMDVDENEEANDVTVTIPPASQSATKKTNRNLRGPSTEGKRTVHDMFPHPLTSASLVFSDLPRRFETAKVDPSGTMVATTDNLGRLILIDLETNQPVRMWKGMRNVACYFTELESGKEGSTKQLYLVIHLRRKGIVEIYRLRQGPRISLVTVPDQNDCAIIECYGPPSDGSRMASFLLEMVVDGGECQYIVDNLIIDDPNVAAKSSTRAQIAQPASQNSRTMQLNLFMQLLASDTNVPCSAAALLATFKQIKTLADLGEGLEALSKCKRLEEEMGVVGSSFHSQAVAHCKSRLDQVKQTESEEGSGMARKAAILDLTSKLNYHDRLISAYDILNNFESKDDPNNTSMEDDVTDLRSLSSWASEALSWLLVASGNAAASARFAPAFPNTQQQRNKLSFSDFAISCSASKSKYKPPSGDNDVVYFTPVKRDRAPIIARIFQPLLRDLFVFKVVNSITTHLGIDTDFDTLQLYFGEWLCSLPSDAIKANMSGNWRPMVRWLHDMILNAFQRNQQNAQDLDDSSLGRVVKLESLLNFCNEIEDLPKAFLIAVICIDAISTASLQIEEKTYGKITQQDSVRPWEIFLRRLRVCLLVSLRLSGDVDSLGGFNPMTVRSVATPNTFSTYAWIAKDELTLSHENQVLVAMEAAYLSSSEAFYPSTPDGDTVNHKQAILQSCSSLQRGSLRNPSGLTSDSVSPPLLFYLKDHGRCTARLAAHRALILVGLWGQTPGNMLLLERCIESLRIVQEENTNHFCLATLIEIWQSRIRPVFQAIMFGFHDVPELSQEVFSPLIEDRAWLSKFTSHARIVLGMITEYVSENPTQFTSDENIFTQDSQMWPPLQECPILSALVSKLRPVKASSVMLHQIVAFTFEMSQDIDSISSAVPSLSRLFSIGSLFSEMPPIPKESLEQRGLIDRAIVERAQNSSSNPVIDNFDCVRDVELVGRAFLLDPKYTKTRYLIEMIRQGRDASINDLLGSSSGVLIKSLFIQEVIQILCARLHSTISSLRRTKHYRSVVSRLDADTCNWVKEQAERITTKDDVYTPVSLITTHSLILRVRGMAENHFDSEQSQSINSLSRISETLLKAVREQEQERVMDL